MNDNAVRLAERRLGTVVVVAVAGRIDHNSANAFRDLVTPTLAACRTGGDSIVLDLAGLEYISSAGLRVFMILSRESRANGGRIVLAAMQPVVREIFDISKFTLLFEIHESVDAALAAIAPGISGRT